MMWWHKGFMASSDSVRPHIWVQAHLPHWQPLNLQRPLWCGSNMFRYHRTDRFLRAASGGWKEKSWTGVSYVLTSVGAKTDVWVTGFQQGSCESFAPDQSWYKSFLLKRFENVLLLHWTANLDLINKALFLNKTSKTCLSTYSASSEIKLTAESLHTQNVKVNNNWLQS